MEKNYNKIEILISMLRELDLQKNSIEAIGYVLNEIADSLENIINGVDEEV